MNLQMQLTHVLPLLACCFQANEPPTLTYTEPFGLAHKKEVLEFRLSKPVEAAKSRLLDAQDEDVPFQVSGDGKRLFLRTDLAAREKAIWRLVEGKAPAADRSLVAVTEDEAHGWYEITNGLTGVRIPNGKTFTDEWALLDDKDKEQAAKNGWELGQVKKNRGITSSNLAPVQGLRLRDGGWTAHGPNLLTAEPFCSGMKVAILERGPLETAVRVHYDFKAKAAVAPYAQDPSRNPGYPGGDGHYTCIIRVAADQPTIEFEEDSDRVPVSWTLNIRPEVKFDTARHPAGRPNVIKPVDTTDFTPQPPWTETAFGRLWPAGEHPFSNYYYLLFDSKGDESGPVVGVFVDKSGNAVNSLASGAEAFLSETAGGFHKAMGFSWPDARVWPLVHQKWGLFVGVKGKDAPPLDKPQPILRQMDRLAGLVPSLRAVTASIPELPRLDWEERSDWINVKTKFNAVGDGKADDTAAIQAALDSLKDGYDQANTVYLPPGIYRITKTLHWKNLYSKHLVGHGRDTRIVWDGAAGGVTGEPYGSKWTDEPSVMFHSNGATAGVRFEGLVWDGAGKAVIGINHCSSTHYESHVIHRHEQFINMGTGIMSSGSPWFPYQNATAEVMFDNCLFVNVASGLIFGSYNALDNTVVHCGFYHCGTGIRNWVGNVYVRDCHFEGSREHDIYTHVGDCSALRCTSVGSQRFLHNSGQMFTLQDCHVEGWKSPQLAVENSAGVAFTLFDCTFKNPPGTQAPVLTRSPVLISNCTSEGTEGVLGKAVAEKALVIPPGKRGPAVTSARQTFFRSAVEIPDKVFDAKRDFGAKGDGKADDTDAIVAAIQAAREHGKRAIAYLPHGQYRVTKTIEVSGADYFIGGAGLGWQAGTLVVWGSPRPAAGGEVAVFHVKNARHVTLEGFRASTPSVYFDDPGVISFLHEASDGPSRVTYDDIGGFTQFRGLATHDRVYLRMLGGIVDFDNCQRATILAEQIHPSRHPQSKRFETTLRVRGQDQSLPKDGLLGIMTMYNAGNPYDVTVEDSQSLVISDYYTEQTWRVLRLSGNPGDTPGRVTILAHKFHGEHVDDLVQVRNYKGEFLLGASPLPEVPITDQEEAKKAGGGTMSGVKVKKTPFVLSHTGENPVDIMLVGCTYGTGAPVFKTEPAATVIQANDNLGHATASDKEKETISAALDDLRRLGEVDLDFKFKHK
ncbi:MAG: glycosyl hydrolase family 28-related protein [Planctomycetota bacterium]|nr:glycosyl hydrolase family 28-related protein [Planctomycetota bacterium]